MAPVQAAIGAYLFSFLQLMGMYFQGCPPTVSVKVFQASPFPLMIFTLLIVSMAQNKHPEQIRPLLGGIARTGRSDAALLVENGSGGVGPTISASGS